MAKNNLIEVGSKANVVLRFKTETTINGETYAINEPYLLFKNANVILDYGNENKSASAGRTIIANSDIYPSVVRIASVNLTRKLMSLMTAFQEESTNFGLTRFETIQPEEDENTGEKFLTVNFDILSGSEDLIFVYEENNFDRLLVTYSAAQNRLIPVNQSELDLTKNYLVSYSSELTGLKFNLQKCSIPYMSLEIQAIGNVDKFTKNVVMYLDKVSLNSVIDFSFLQDDLISVPLDFNIIENKKNYIWIED